jgi:hypothetical protein
VHVQVPRAWRWAGAGVGLLAVITRSEATKQSRSLGGCWILRFARNDGVAYYRLFFSFRVASGLLASASFTISRIATNVLNERTFGFSMNMSRVKAS